MSDPSDRQCDMMYHYESTIERLEQELEAAKAKLETLLSVLLKDGRTGDFDNRTFGGENKIKQYQMQLEALRNTPSAREVVLSDTARDKIKTMLRKVKFGTKFAYPPTEDYKLKYIEDAVKQVEKIISAETLDK